MDSVDILYENVIRDVIAHKLEKLESEWRGQLAKRRPYQTALPSGAASEEPQRASAASAAGGVAGRKRGHGEAFPGDESGLSLAAGRPLPRLHPEQRALEAHPNVDPAAILSNPFDDPIPLDRVPLIKRAPKRHAALPLPPLTAPSPAALLRFPASSSAAAAVSGLPSLPTVPAPAPALAPSAPGSVSASSYPAAPGIQHPAPAARPPQYDGAGDEPFRPHPQPSLQMSGKGPAKAGAGVGAGPKSRALAKGKAKGKKKPAKKAARSLEEKRQAAVEAYADLDAAELERDDFADDAFDAAPARDAEAAPAHPDMEEELGPQDDESDAEDEAAITNLILCQYDKIQLQKQKWKVVLRDGIINIDGHEYLFKVAKGELDW